MAENRYSDVISATAWILMDKYESGELDVDDADAVAVCGLTMFTLTGLFVFYQRAPLSQSMIITERGTNRHMSMPLVRPT